MLQKKMFNYGRLFSLVLLTMTTIYSSAQSGSEHTSSVRILALGDSLTAGLGLAAENSFPAQLQQALIDRGRTVEIINAGVSGDTTTGGLARLDWALADQPDAVILALGANDGLRAIDPHLTQENLARILSKLQAEQLPVLLLGMLAPPNLGPEYEKDFNAIYPTLAEQFDIVLYPFFLEGVAAQPELNQSDGIHPNKEGVAYIVEKIVPYAEELLTRIEKP